MAKKLSELRTGHAAPRQKKPGNPGGVVLIGAPDDRGVFNVGGRIGAATGPLAARTALDKLMLGPLDKGEDISTCGFLEEAHRRLRAATTGALKSGQTPIVIGGGHDYGYPHIGGMADAFGVSKIGLINIDAHLDVRETTGGVITSGSPYFLALEEGCLQGPHFVEFGIQPHCNKADRFAYLKSRKARVLMLGDARGGAGGIINSFRRELKKLLAKKLKVAVSVDLDAVANAYAPGVSAPQADGLTPAELFAIMEECGTSAGVVSLGFFELAPPLDRDDMTARLCATAIHRFVCAIPNRPASKRR